MKSWLRRILSILIGLMVLVMVIAWLAGFFETKIAPGLQSVEAKIPTEATIVTVQEMTSPYVTEVVGTLKAASRTEIASKILAIIDTITVTAGDSVETGDVVVRLGDEELQARVMQAEQGLAAAQATLVQAQADFRRAREMYRGKAIHRSQFDDANTRLQVAKARHSQAQHALNEATTVLSYAVIEAPKAGRIVDRLSEPGNMARPGHPLLVLYDSASLRLEVPVVESVAVRLKRGAVLPVVIDALERRFEARIDEIVPQADAASRSFLVKVALPAAEDLYEGMFGRLRIPAGSRRYLCVPIAAVRTIGQLEFVRVARPENGLEQRFVKLGQSCDTDRVEVLSGLKAGDRVVLLNAPS